MNRTFGFFAKKAGGQGSIVNPQVNITPSADGNVITFAIDTNLPSGQELFYSIDGTVDSNDFIGDGLTGNLTLDINGNASLDFTANLSPSGNVSEFYFNLRKTSISGDSLGTSGNIVLESNNAVDATGGAEEVIGNFKYHTFDTSNTYFVIGSATSNAIIDFMIVGKGGAAGTDPFGNNGGGGGGAGRLLVGKMWALDNNTYQMRPANPTTGLTSAGMYGNIIIAASSPLGNTFGSLVAIKGGDGGDTLNDGDFGGSGGGAGTHSQNSGTYTVQLGGDTAGFAYANIGFPEYYLRNFGSDGNVSQYWPAWIDSGGQLQYNGRNGGAGGGGALTPGLCRTAISSSPTINSSTVNVGGNGGNGYVWIDGNTYAAGGPGQGWIGAANGTTQASIAGAGAGPGVPEANTYGIVKVGYNYYPRTIEIL